MPKVPQLFKYHPYSPTPQHPKNHPPRSRWPKNSPSRCWRTLSGLPATAQTHMLHILLMFLQTVLRHPEGLAIFERAIPWADLATFLGRGPRVSSNHTQSEKLSKSGILPGNWAMLGMVWPGQLFEGGFRDGGEGQLMEVECWTPTTPFPKRWTKMACGRMTSTQMISSPAKSRAGRRWHGDAPCGLARRLPRSSPVPLGWKEDVVDRQNTCRESAPMGRRSSSPRGGRA